MATPHRISIPAGGARAVRAPAAATIRVVNVAGGQVVDTWAFSSEHPDEHLSMEHSRSATYRLHYAVGDTLVSNRFRPIVTITADTSPGRHDTLHAACSAASNRFYGAATETPNCEENLITALDELGIARTSVPCPWNLYEHARVAPDGTLSDEPATARAGDYVEFRAEMDLIVVCSACPSTVGAISGAGQSPRGAVIELR